MEIFKKSNFVKRLFFQENIFDLIKALIYNEQNLFKFWVKNNIKISMKIFNLKLHNLTCMINLEHLQF